MGIFEDMATILNGGSADKSLSEKVEKKREYFRKMGYSGKDNPNHKR